MKSELGTIRNSSESQDGGTRGRKPRVSDQELDRIVSQHVKTHGALPTLDQIIERSGGCQRARAVSARRRNAQRKLQEAARAQLRLPDVIETQHRELLGKWLDLAKEAIQPLIDETVCNTQMQLVEMESALLDARHHQRRLQDLLDNANENLELQQIKTNDVITALERMKLSEAKWRAVAAERMLRMNELRGRYID